MLMSYAPVADGSWGYVVGAPTSEVLASVHSLRTTLILIELLALLVIALGIWFAAQRLARPITEIGAAARRISKGDLDRDRECRR